MTGREYVTLLKKSPHKAHQALFDEYCNYVSVIVCNKLRSCGGREDIEECVSDIFAAVYFNLNSDSKYSGELKGYIGTVAKHKAIDKFRSLSVKSSRRADINENDFNKINDGYDLEEETERSELQNILLDKIEELGEPDSTIIIQKFYYNRTSTEIAKMLSMNSAAVRMRCTRALKRLKTELTKVGIDA